MNEEKLEVELERLAKLLRQLPEVEEEVDRCEEALDAARSNVEYVRSGIAEVRARVCNLLMPPNIVVAGPALTPVSEEKDEGLLADQQHTPPQSNAQASETDAAEIPEGFTKWEGGPPPSDDELVIQYMLDDGHFDTAAVSEIDDWQDIVAYRAVEAPPMVRELDSQVQDDGDRVDQTNTDTVAAVEIPEGFIPWSGGECPVDRLSKIEVILKSGHRDRHWLAGDWDGPSQDLSHWSADFGEGRIIAYKVISEPAEASETPPDFLTRRDEPETPEPSEPPSELDSQDTQPASSEQSQSDPITNSEASFWNAGFEEDRKPKPGFIEGAVSKLFGVKEPA